MDGKSDSQAIVFLKGLEHKGFLDVKGRILFDSKTSAIISQANYLSTREKDRPMAKFPPIVGCVLLVSLIVALPAPAAEKVLHHDTGEMTDKKSHGGAGHVIEFAISTGSWWIKSVEIYGQPYGGGYNPRETFFTVSVCDSGLDELTAVEAPYSLFKYGLFKWTEVVFDEPIRAPRKFKIVVDFNATSTKGIFVGYSTVKKSHSSFGRPGQGSFSFEPDKEWMIRVNITSKKPKTTKKSGSAKGASTKGSTNAALYKKDFDYLKRTVRSQYPALRKKDIDWVKVCKEWEPRFKECPDDETHLLNVYQLLAVLADSHTGITSSKVSVHTGGFDNMFGGGLWIATDRGRILLRALSDGHQFSRDLDRGAELVRIDGRPARIVLAETRRRARQWSGWSSDHFLDARLSFQFFHMEKDLIPATFLNADGKIEEVKVPRWGPGGRGLSRQAATMPDGVDAKGLAVSEKLNSTIGYIRILGSMNDATRNAFDAAFDELRGVETIILDCRGMGGGGDSAAWAMAGRFYSKKTPLGTSRALEPTGDWQFDGPVIMLQDEREISSAETFTWAMTETGRAVAVGRPTGGATIIPRMFNAPSKLFSFRMGTHDRATPIRKIKPEGTGTPPDVFVPYEPGLLERHGDPILAAATDIALYLVGGAERAVVVDYYGGLLGAEPERVKKAQKKFDALDRPSKQKGFTNVTDGVVEEMIDWEIALCESKHNPMPDFSGAADRLEELSEIAALLGLDKAAARAAEAPKSWKKEIAAQNVYATLEELLLEPDHKALKGFLKKYGKTRYGKAVRDAFE